MKTTFPIESHTSPAPGIIPERSVVHDERVEPSGRGRPRSVRTTAPARVWRTPLARLLAALRGDKYMVDAYPSALPPAKEQ